MAQYVYTMNRVSKIVPPKREILKDISLSFFPGAKIGVLGLNGAGKSSLLRIMAGVDREFDGEARPQADIKVGYLPQEPELDPSKDVRGNVEEGVGETKALVDEFNEISMKFAEPMDDDEMNRLLERQGELQSAIDAAQGWDLERTLEIAADALRLPPWDADVTKLSGGERRRVALCRLLLSNPDMLLLDEPTNHLDAESVGWLERFLTEYPGTVVAITHDRYFLDNAAQWILELDRGRGIPYEGNYSTWLEAKEKRLAQEARSEASRQRALKAELEWVRANPKGRQAKSKARLARFDELNSKEYQKRNETNEIFIPPGPRLGDVVINFDGVQKQFGDKVLFEDLSFIIPPGHTSWALSGRTAPVKPPSSASSPATSSPTAARSRSAKRCRSPTSARCATSSTTARPFGKRSRKASTSSKWGALKSPAGPTSDASTSRARTSRSAWATSPAGSATGSSWRSC